MRVLPKHTRALWLISAVILAIGAIASVAFVAGTIGSRLPYWGEAETLFEASRVRSGYPLFIDPLVGAHEYGPPPSRYYVTYPPLLTYLTALFPRSIALVAGRGLASGLWFGTLAWIALTARRESRANAIAAAAFVSGLWILVNFAMVGRPDSLALALAGIGLTRAIRRSRADVLSIVLLVLGAWVKPTMLGLPAGALLADTIARRRPVTLAIAAGVFLAVGAALYAASHGALIEHVVRSNAQPLTLEIWLERVPGRVPFFAPLFFVAFWHALPRRASHGIAIGIGALTGAILWTLVSIAKTGSAANYWMEPCMAAVALIAHAHTEGRYRFFGTERALPAVLTLAAILYSHVASISASIDRIGKYREEARIVGQVRDRCGASPDELVASDEQGIELLLNDRILTPGYQTAWLVRRGRFPADVWIEDLTAPNVRCYVTHSHTLLAAPAVLRAVDERFPNVYKDGELEIRYRLR